MKNDKDEIELPEESKVGKKLGDLTTRRVIILVLAMLFSVPLFSPTTYIDEQESHTLGMQLMLSYPKESSAFTVSYNSFIEEEVALNYPFIYLLQKEI